MDIKLTLYPRYCTRKIRKVKPTGTCGQAWSGRSRSGHLVSYQLCYSGL